MIAYIHAIYPCERTQCLCVSNLTPSFCFLLLHRSPALACRASVLFHRFFYIAETNKASEKVAAKLGFSPVNDGGYHWVGFDASESVCD